MERLYFAGMLVLATYGGFFAVLPPRVSRRLP